MNVIIIGANGVGKGTVAEKLQKKLGLTHVSTGDMFVEYKDRLSNAHEPEWFNEVRELISKSNDFVKKGVLVPNDITFRILELRKKELRDRPENKAHKGWMYDGFPRNFGQAIELDAWIKREGESVDLCMYLDAPQAVCANRIKGRIAQLKKEGKEPKMSMEKELERLAKFFEEIHPLTYYYKELGILRKVYAGYSPIEVFETASEVILAKF